MIGIIRGKFKSSINTILITFIYQNIVKKSKEYEMNKSDKLVKFQVLDLKK